MEVNYGVVEFKNLKRAFTIIDNIKNYEGNLKEEEISAIAVNVHRDKYLLPMSHKYGSLFLFAIEMLNFKEALFLVENNITINDSQEDIINSLNLAEEEYIRLNELNIAKELYEKNENVFGLLYKRELQNDIALSKLKELYPVKKRVLN